MPLILICGPPASGKTTRAQLIQQLVKEKANRDSIIVNEELLKMIKQNAYKDSTQEKITRGALKSNVEKYIQNGQFVIFDSMNYIKGFRYEVYCISRAVKTTYCLLYCNTPYEVCKEWNAKRENGFDEKLFEELYKRMETPKQKDRWDSPYFEVRANEQLPIEDIIDTLFNQEKKAKDPTATKIEKQQEGNYVLEQEKRIQEIIDLILSQQQQGFIKYKLQTLIIKRPYTLLDLKKLRIEFINMIRINPTQNLDQVQEVFVNYLINHQDRID